jgi:rod shape determining protein RodA
LSEVKLLTSIIKNSIAKDPVITVGISVLILISLFILNSLIPGVFPQYYIYIFLSVFVYVIFVLIGFDIFKYFSLHFYIVGLIFLLLTLVVGKVTRGTVRWISIGEFGFQSSEIVKPFLILFYAKFISENKISKKNVILFILIPLLPILFIAVQPSFGVALVTFSGLFAVFVLKYFDLKKIFIFMFFSVLFVIGIWFTLKPYQKERLIAFTNYSNDPLKSGYNTIQSIISVGSGGIIGRGFKKGFQTQLKYLPEKHTDFIFASISEEFGFVGSVGLLIFLFLLLWRVLTNAFGSKDEIYRLFSVGVFTIFLVEIFINVGMNLGILPITGLPLPFVSLGGSSLISSIISVALVVGGKI